MKRYLMRLLGLSTGAPHAFSGQYVVSYDPDYHWADGSYDGGRLECTPDIRKAGRFTLGQLMTMRCASPKCQCHRLRPDGEPNRPLSAFHIEGLPAEDGALVQ